MSTSAEPLLLSVKEVSRRLAIAERTVRAWIATGRLPVVRLARRCVRVPAEAVERIARGEAADSLSPNKERGR